MKPIEMHKGRRLHEPKRMLGVTKMDLLRSERAGRKPNWVERIRRYLAVSRRPPFWAWLEERRMKVCRDYLWWANRYRTEFCRLPWRNRMDDRAARRWCEEGDGHVRPS